MPRGKKICPSCSTECGVRTSICKCSHNFSSVPKKENGGEEKKTNEKKPEYVSPKTQELLDHVALNPYVEPEKMSADEHADRILAYGKNAALNLLRQHRSGNSWSHVNWNRVEAGL